MFYTLIKHEKVREQSEHVQGPIYVIKRQYFVYDICHIRIFISSVVRSTEY